MLFVISSPSGGGKTTIIRELFSILPGLRFSVSATTRPKRKIEKEAKDYYFITKKEFEDKISNNEFVEWELVHGQYYGTLKSEVDKYVNSPLDLIFDVDVKGALNIKKIYPKAVSIFIEAPREDLIKRLKKRSTESDEEITRRLERIDMEISYKDKFDFIVPNNSNPDGIKNAVNEIISIINKSKV